MKMKYAINEEAAKELREKRKEIKDKYAERRLHAVQLRGEGKKTREIAEKLDADKRQISRWSKQYCEGGIDALLKPLGGRRRENLTFQEEEKLLNEFKEKSENGQIIEVSEIRKEYEKRTHPSKSKGQIYRVLHRHGWRKIKPRSKHPKKASSEAIEASKKLTIP